MNENTDVESVEIHRRCAEVAVFWIRIKELNSSTRGLLGLSAELDITWHPIEAA